MTKQEFGKLCAAMKAAYADPKFLADQMAMNMWYEALKDMSYNDLQKSLMRHIQTSEFLPTVASLRKGCSSAGAGIKSPEAAWEDVWKAIHKVSSSEPDSYRMEFDKLDAATQRTLGSPGALERLSMMYESDIDKYEKPHFLKDYRNVAASNPAPVDTTPKIEAHFPQIEQKEEERGYTESARQMISNLRMQLGGAG